VSNKVLILLAVIGIALGGCNTQDFNDEDMEKAKKVTESFLINNYQDIEIVESIGVEKGQLGGIMVKRG